MIYLLQNFVCTSFPPPLSCSHRCESCVCASFALPSSCGHRCESFVCVSFLLPSPCDHRCASFVCVSFPLPSSCGHRCENFISLSFILWLSALFSKLWHTEACDFTYSDFISFGHLWSCCFPVLAGLKKLSCCPWHSQKQQKCTNSLCPTWWFDLCFACDNLYYIEHVLKL